MAKSFLLYGSYGYTGNLIAQEAHRRGMRPVLAGRDPQKLRLQALSLGFDHRSFSLDDPAEIDAIVGDYPIVLHCAGPFAHTARPMVDACLRAGSHYLDITGELAVFKAIADRDAQARDAGVMLLPGVGFDVVPTDCLALHLKKQLPSATHLTLAIRSLGGGVSRGTARSALENLHRAGAVRENGEIKPVPAAWKTRRIDFGRGPKKSVLIPWGDVFTAYYTTGIPNIEVYNGNLGKLYPLLLLLRYLKWLLTAELVQAFLKARIRTWDPGPSAEQLEHGKSVVWGEVVDETAGERRSARLYGPQTYRLTALVALAAVEKALTGEAPPGFQTPAGAFGQDFVLEIEGTRREDLPDGS